MLYNVKFEFPIGSELFEMHISRVILIRQTERTSPSNDDRVCYLDQATEGIELNKMILAMFSMCQKRSGPNSAVIAVLDITHCQSAASLERMWVRELALYIASLAYEKMVRAGSNLHCCKILGTDGARIGGAVRTALANWRCVRIVAYFFVAGRLLQNTNQV